MRAEWRLSVRLAELGEARALEAAATLRLGSCTVTRTARTVQVEAPDRRRRNRAERVLHRSLAELEIEERVRLERWDPRSDAWRVLEPDPWATRPTAAHERELVVPERIEPAARPSPRAPQQERLTPRIVWIDATTLRWEVRARFRDADEAWAEELRLRDELPMLVHWRRGRKLSVYTTTQEEAADVAARIAAAVPDVRPLSRRRAWWMRQHLAGNYEYDDRRTRARYERRIIEREVSAAGVGAEADGDVDAEPDASGELDFEVDSG